MRERLNEFTRSYGHYAFLNEFTTLGRVIEYGAGGYTQTRNLLERHKIDVEHVTLVDPLIRQYTKLEGCSYDVHEHGRPKAATTTIITTATVAVGDTSGSGSGSEATATAARQTQTQKYDKDDKYEDMDCWASTTYTTDYTEKLSCALSATLTVNSSMLHLRNTVTTQTVSTVSTTASKREDGEGEGEGEAPSKPDTEPVPVAVLPVRYAATTVNCSVEAYGRRYLGSGALLQMPLNSTYTYDKMSGKGGAGAGAAPPAAFEQFDTVIVMNVLVYSRNAFEFLETLYRTLKPGGLLIFHDRYFDDPVKSSRCVSVSLLPIFFPLATHATPD